MASAYAEKSLTWIHGTWMSVKSRINTQHDVVMNYSTMAEDYDEDGRDCRDVTPPSRGAVDRLLLSVPYADRVSTRFTVGLFASFGLLISFGMRCNISVAVVNMTDNKTMLDEHGNNVTRPEYDWPPGVRAVVDSSFLYGYLFTQIPGGYLASRYPANRIFGIAILCTSILNMFVPMACRTHYSMVVVLRMCQGLVEGVSYPATHGIWRYWAPPLERSRLATITFCGSYAGAVIGMPLSGLLTANWGWYSPFYVYGLFGIIWFVVWNYIGYEKPCKHPRITEEEKHYIEDKINENTSVISNKLLRTPWRSFMTSLPVWAIIVANFCRSWSFYLLITSQPKYFNDVLQYNINKSAMLSALPHLMMTIVVPFGGHLADNLRRNEILTTTNVRKLFNCGGFGMEAVFLLAVGISQSRNSALAFLTLAVGVSGFAISGFNVNHLDIAPRYASILMGLSNGVGTLSGIFCTVTTELITRTRSRDEWKTVFIIAAFVHFTGVAFYAIFASGEKQDWADPPVEELERRKSQYSLAGNLGNFNSGKTYGAVEDAVPIEDPNYMHLDRYGRQMNSDDSSNGEPCN